MHTFQFKTSYDSELFEGHTQSSNSESLTCRDTYLTESRFLRFCGKVGTDKYITALSTYSESEFGTIINQERFTLS